MAQLGRISGPLLTENLLRNGIDLAFSNDRTDASTTLLYLDVTNNYIGINTDTPVRELSVEGAAKSNNLFATTRADIANLEFTTGKIENISDNIFIRSSDAIVVPTLRNSNIEINDNYISTYTTNTDLQLIANSAGTVVFDADTSANDLQLNGLSNLNNVNITGDLTTTGNVLHTGNLTINGFIDTGNIKIEGNYIVTTDSNSNIELKASGTGIVNFSSLQTLENFTVIGTTLANNISATGTVTTPNLNITNDLAVNRNISLENIDIIQNRISVTSTDTNLTLSPAGTGSVELIGDTNVTGSIHATGNVTMDGDFIIGDQDTDNLILNAEINSSIVPTVGGIYDFGSSTSKWSTVNSLLLNGEELTAGAVTVDGSDLDRRQGNVFYVAINGDDTNVGDHQQGPFRTIKHALTVADSSIGGPVTIYIYPGEYEEEFPLTIPSNTTVKGLDLRNCIIFPTVATQSEDVFLMTGETTVEDLTIKNFYYDSLNDKGYAFRFASNAITTTRSPYVRNITVITQGSTISASDPRGFASGDAGKGALIKGTDVNSASADAAMLFHSCTFITPGVDAITMTGGVRVEWLNCFTYFANRGLYAFNDATGRVNQDGSTINKGAEIRSIGSASVYGNIGAEADGDETLMYLINHNFAYIGSGKDASNDTTLVIQSNETVELNSGKIYYTSQDAGGNFRVGDAFVVDFERGTTSLSDSDVALTGISSITVNTSGDETFINAEKIETGNWRIADNTISALIGDGNLAAASGTINFTNNVNMQSNLSMTGNFTMSGANFTLGNASGDSITFEAEVTSDIIPKLENIYTLGTDAKRWNTVWLSNASIDELEINDNYIQTINSNADLELRANSSGNILFSSNTQIDNNITVNNTANLADTVLTTVTHSGDLEHVGDKTQTGDKTISGELSVTATANFENIKIDTNFISTTTSNADLELRANGTGEVLFATDSEIDNDLYLGTQSNLADIVVTAEVALENLVVDDIRVSDNRIETTSPDTDLILNPDGIGRTYIAENNLEIDNTFTVNNNTFLQTTNIIGATSQTGSRTISNDLIQTGATTIIGNINTGSNAKIEDILFAGNVISTTTSNSDLDLRASGTGVVRFNNNTVIPNDIQVNGTITANGINTPTSLDLNELVVNNNLEINDNYITTTVSNSDLELRATQDINLQNSLLIDNNLIVNNIFDATSSVLTGTLQHIGNTEQQGNYNLIGNYLATGKLTVGATAQFENVEINDNTVKTTASNSNLELRSSGTGLVRFNANARVDNNVTIGGTVTANDIIINTDLDINKLVTPSNILIDDNYITTTETNSNLDLRANGTGFVKFQDIAVNNNTITTESNDLVLSSNSLLDVNTTGALILPTGTYAQGTNTLGDIRYNSEFEVFQGYATANFAFNGVYSDNFLTRVRVNATDNILRFDVNNNPVATIDSGINLLAAQIDDVNLNSNILSTDVSNSNLEFTANGSGEVKLNNLSFGTNTITNTAGNNLSLASTSSGYYKVSGTNGIVVTIGDTLSRRILPVQGEFRFNTDTNVAEIFNGTVWEAASGPLGESISADLMEDITDEYTLIFG